MKIIIRVLLVFVLAGVIAVAALKQNAIAAARAEHQVLLGEGEEAQRLAEQNKGILRLLGEHEEVEKLREENKDLPKLRNEMRQLRRQAEELAKLRQENDRLRAVQEKGPGNAGGAPQLPAGFIKRSDLADAGRSSPENTIKTFFWAVFNGNLQKVKECMTPEMAQKLPADDEHFRQDNAEAAKAFPGYRIISQSQISADEVVVQIGITDGDGDGHATTLKRFGNEWKIESE